MSPDDLSDNRWTKIIFSFFEKYNYFKVQIELPASEFDAHIFLYPHGVSSSQTNRIDPPLDARTKIKLQSVTLFICHDRSINLSQEVVGIVMS